MAIFKRFEVWLLLLLSAAGVGYVLWSENSKENGAVDSDPGEEPPEVAEQPPSRFEVREIRTVPDGDNRVIEIELLGRNDDPEPEELTPESVRLLAKYDDEEEATELPSFFLAFDPPPVLAPESESIVSLKYWLEPRAGNGNPSLTLEIGDETLHFLWTDGAYLNFKIGYQF